MSQPKPRYLLILLDGAADEPLDALNARTPLEAASTPHLDRIAREGRVGRAHLLPPAVDPLPSAAAMVMLGYPPDCYTGPGPLQALGRDVRLGPQDTVFRLDLISAPDGVMQRADAGQLNPTESESLVDRAMQGPGPSGFKIERIHSHASLWIDHFETNRRDWSELQTTPPGAMIGRPLDKHLPVGGALADELVDLIHASGDLLAEHEINLTRREFDEPPVTHVWPWGQGVPSRLRPFPDLFGVLGVVLTQQDTMRGLSRAAGLDTLDMPADLDELAVTAAEALDWYNFALIHLTSVPGDPVEKCSAIERVDRELIGPLSDVLLQDETPARVMVTPGCSIRSDGSGVDPMPVPFVLSGYQVRSAVPRRFTEPDAAASDLQVEFGHELMEYVLRSGLRR